MNNFMNNFRLNGKVTLVTGATIYSNDLKQEFVDKGLAAYEAEGIKVHGYVCGEEGRNAMIKQIKEDVGVVDIRVSNAGIIKRSPMCEMTAASWPPSASSRNPTALHKQRAAPAPTSKTPRKRPFLFTRGQCFSAISYEAKNAPQRIGTHFSIAF